MNPTVKDATANPFARTGKKASPAAILHDANNRKTDRPGATRACKPACRTIGEAKGSDSQRCRSLESGFTGRTALERSEQSQRQTLMDLCRRRGVTSLAPSRQTASRNASGGDEPAVASDAAKWPEGQRAGERKFKSTASPASGVRRKDGNVQTLQPRLATERRARQLRKETGSRMEQTLKGRTPWTAPRWKRLGR